MLPPRHSVTLNPSSSTSPVNSRLTPARREPDSAWMCRAEVSSDTIAEKRRVLRPVVETCVLRYGMRLYERYDQKEVILTCRAWGHRSRQLDGPTSGQLLYAPQGGHRS